MFKETERYLKRLIKGKRKFTKMLVFTFLMTGSLGMAVPITPNANGEYIVNSSTGDGEITSIPSLPLDKKLRVSEGQKLIVSEENGIYSADPVITLTNSNTEIEIGTPIIGGISRFSISGDKEKIIYSVTDPITGVSSSANNQKVTLTDVHLISNNNSHSMIKVEARNGNSIKDAELNLIGRKDENTVLDNKNGWVIEVEGDASTNSYSELTVNTKADPDDEIFDVDISGLMHKEGKSVLNVNLTANTIWIFYPNPNLTQQRSTINNLTITKGGVLETEIPTETDNKTAIYYLKLTSDGINNDGILTNGGVIDLSNGESFFENVFTIEGNYNGNNGEIWLGTEWNTPGDANGGNSQSDLMYITGNATGSTKVVPIYVDDTLQENVFFNYITGNVQQLSTRINSVPVVKVAGNSSPTTFTGTAKTAGAVEAQLTSRQVNGVWEYYWTIDPIGATGKPVVTPGTTGGVTPGGIGAIIPGTTSGGGSPTTKPIYIMSQPVSSYVLMPKVNMEMGYSTIGTLHERRSENQILELENMNTDKGQIWTRVYGRGLNEKGKTRFGYESNLWGVQVGHDFKINEDEKGNKHLLGGYIAYNNTKTDFFDKYRAVNGVVVNDKLTGEGKSESISLGLTKTKYTEKGTYYDLVGQVSVLQNKYESRDGDKAKQKGYGVVLSAEVGKPFVISKNTEKESTWSFEPQAQLIYQYLNNKSFNDGLRKVEQEVNHGLRGRAGFRIAYNGKSENHTERTNSYYAVANIWHDFTNNGNKYTKIGGDRINEEVGKTWGEIGLGAQAPVGEKSNLYIDTRYEHSLSDSNHKGYRATVGFKHTF